MNNTTDEWDVFPDDIQADTMVATMCRYNRKRITGMLREFLKGRISDESYCQFWITGPAAVKKIISAELASRYPTYHNAGTGSNDCNILVPTGGIDSPSVRVYFFTDDNRIIVNKQHE
jgi:hypothetical protein